MLTGIKAVIFDLDGTLMDSMGIWRDIDIEFLGERNIPFEPELQEKIEGMSFTETAEFFKSYYNLSETIEELKTIWNDMAEFKYRHEIQPKPGAMEFLADLKAKGIKMGIASSNSSELIAAITEAWHLDDYITTVVTSCSVNKGKPAPDVYLEAARQLGVEPCDCLVFEDIVKGIMAGKNAGMKVCAIEDENSAFQREEKKKLCDYYIESYDDIKNQTYEVYFAEDGNA